MLVPVDLSKLRDVVKNDVIKKTEYYKVNNFDTSGFILKAKYDVDKLKVEKKKFLILVLLLKNQTIIIKSQKLKIKFLILVV